MAEIRLRLYASDVRRAVKERVQKPIIALTKNPDVMRQIGNKAIKIVTPYVPMKSGDLRDSAYVRQTSRATQLVWGHPSVGKTYQYASYQHDADDSNWKRTTEGTKSNWTEEIMPGSSGFEELADYAASIVVKEIKRGNK